MYALHMVDNVGNRRTISYDPATSSCVWADTGERVAPEQPRPFKTATVVSPAQPGKKSRTPKVVKIQLGLKCNYACSYCNQRAQPHDMQGNPAAVDRFLAKLPTWLQLAPTARFEFWGGEPLVYWKSLKPLAEGIRSLYPEAEFNIITNVSMLTDEHIDWLDEMGFQVGVSHDGPAYEAARGADPLLIPEQRDMIRKLYDRLAPKGRIGFNCVLTKHNTSLTAVREWIGKHLGINPHALPLSTEELVLAYEEDAVELAIDDDIRSAMHTFFWEAVANPMVTSTTTEKMTDFLNSLANGRPASALGQKCGMDRQDNIAVDLNGNVLTCQNTSPLTKHRVGHLEAFDHIKLNTAHHWSTREECVRCPVVQLCKGACLFLEDRLWQHACDSSWTYNLAMLAASMMHATKMLLVRIEGPALRRSGITSEEVIDLDWYVARARQTEAA